MKCLLLLVVLSLSGCATYRAQNRILMCFGFCALQGIHVAKHGDDLVIDDMTRCLASPTREEP